MLYTSSYDVLKNIHNPITCLIPYTNFVLITQKRYKLLVTLIPFSNKILLYLLSQWKDNLRGKSYPKFILR